MNEEEIKINVSTNSVLRFVLLPNSGRYEILLPEMSLFFHLFFEKGFIGKKNNSVSVSNCGMSGMFVSEFPHTDLFIGCDEKSNVIE